MILNIILISAAVLSLAAIIFIIARKIPPLRVLDVESVPETQTARARERLLLERMKRQTEKSRELLKSSAAPLGRLIKKICGMIWHRFLNWEKRYQDEAKAKTPASAGEASAKITALLEEAGNLIKNEKLNEAEKFYIEIISASPSNIEAYQGLADIYLKRKEYKEAKETKQFVLKLILKADKSRPASRKNTGQIKKVSEAHFDIAEIDLLAGELDKAKASFKRALECEPSSPKYLDKLIQLGIMLKDRNLAEGMLARLAEVNPENQKLKEYEGKIGEMN
jgi:tetratricopeptide (TPR) repeat protein